MNEALKEMSWDELEQRRQRDIESGAAEHGETAAMREMRRREGDPAASITITRGEHHHVRCNLESIFCGACGENLHGKMAWLSSSQDSYCEECYEKYSD